MVISLKSQKIVLSLAEHHGVRVKDILSGIRQNHIMKARRDIMAVLFLEQKHLSLPKIGKIMNKHHTTVLHGIRKHGLTQEKIWPTHLLHLKKIIYQISREKVSMNKTPMNSCGLKIIEVPNVTTDTARELMFHHLGLAASYFEACGESVDENRDELRRQFAGTFVEEEHPTFKAGVAFLDVMHNAFDKIDREIAKQGLSKLDPKGAASGIRRPKKFERPSYAAAARAAKAAMMKAKKG